MILTVSPPIIYVPVIGEKKPEKNFRASTGFEHVTSANTSAIPILFILSSISFMGKIEPTKNDLTPNVWLHSSVIALVFVEVTGSNPVEALNFFQYWLLFSQLHKLVGSR